MVQVGEFAGLKVVSASRMGALNWGNEERLVRSSPQAKPMQNDHTYVVYVYLDRESRTVATSRLDHYLSMEMPHYEREKQEVDILICERTDLGYKVIVESKFWGLVFNNEIFTTLRIGQQTKGYIKKIHEDGKLDISRINQAWHAKMKPKAWQAFCCACKKQAGSCLSAIKVHQS